MRSDREDALSWEGDDDPTLDAGAVTARDPQPTSPLPDGFTAVGRGSTDYTAALDETPAREAPVDDSADSPDSGDRPPARVRPMGNAALIGLGVLGGVYALYAIGWLIGGFRLQGRAQYLVTDVMFQGSLWLAVLAPVLWFGTVYLLTRLSRAWVRFAWLGAGVALLLPWPFVMIGAVGTVGS